MPTIFSKCIDCNYIDTLPIDHKLNAKYNTHYKIMKLLEEKGLPREIAIKIIKMNKKYGICSRCNERLCNSHYIRAAFWGKHYHGYGSLCDSCSCCWWEIS